MTMWIKKNEMKRNVGAFKEKSDKFVRGIPQGLPQSYFLGNIYMISIAEIFRKKIYWSKLFLRR